MTWIDTTVFFAFLAYVVWDGMRRAKGTKTLEGYFAGRRSIPWWAAGLSIMATQASAITVIGTTGQGHDGGMEFVQTYFGLPVRDGAAVHLPDPAVPQEPDPHGLRAISSAASGRRPAAWPA